jgi:alpha-glucosidase
MELLGSIPTTWDETIIPQAKLGEFIITVRKKGDDWFIGAMSNWDARSLQLELDFLGEGNYGATICEDGMNADRYAADYKLSEKMLSASDTVDINLAPGGGYLLRLRKLK